jgi:hypothetical protein
VSTTAAEAITAALLCALIFLLAWLGARGWRNSRVSPEEKEWRRRAVLVAKGKMGDANLVDINDSLVTYSYLVRGDEYTTSQDVSRLKEFLPADLSQIGPVLVRYDARDPANSIVLAEDWSGLHSQSPISAPRPGSGV